MFVWTCLMCSHSSGSGDSNPGGDGATCPDELSSSGVVCLSLACLSFAPFLLTLK